MTVKALSEAIKGKILAGESGADRQASSVYICDLLSWAMSKAAAGDCWITVMGNLNAIAVASLTDVACIILPENASLDDDAKKKADELAIPVLSSEKSAYSLSLKLSELL